MLFPVTKLSAFSHLEYPTSDSNPPVFCTEEGKVGVAFELPVLDSEAPQFDGHFDALTSLISRLKPGVILRVIHRTGPVNKPLDAGARKEAIVELGRLESKTYLLIECDNPSPFGLRDFVGLLRGRKPVAAAKEFRKIFECVDLGLIRELGAKPASEAQVRGLFAAFHCDPIAGKEGIDAATDVIGVVRLVRQGTCGLNPSSLAVLREGLIAPYSISVTVRKMSPGRAQYILQRKRAQLATSTDSLTAKVFQETEHVAAETVLSGKGLVEMEWLLTLDRRSEQALREDVSLSNRALSQIGEIYTEVQGAAASFAATIPGSPQHHTFMELDDIAPHYLPLFGRGSDEGKELESVAPRRSIPLHRRDGSLYFFDPWRKGFDGANVIINGRRGRGKSVLANLISTSLLNDPDIRLIKVDVGSSYVKECALVGGKHIQFSLSEPSGLNPFALLNQTEFTEDAALVLAGFLSALVMESRESQLSKEMLGLIERQVMDYAERREPAPSLAHFLEKCRDFPRRSLLERFGPQGVFANVLKERSENAAFDSNRYVYFNFERLQNAANEDFAQAVMAAVIATTNMEVLRAGDARRGAKHKVVFFADETPFFIQRNGRFFKLTTANFRKFGHATILIAQSTQDFELPREGGEPDLGILINSPIRFFYQVDGDPDEFAKRFGLTTSQITEIQKLGRGDGFREVFLHDELGARVLRVAVTPEEFWRVTSSRADNERLQALLSTVPGLKLEEAIRCLALV